MVEAVTGDIIPLIDMKARFDHMGKHDWDSGGTTLVSAQWPLGTYGVKATYGSFSLSTLLSRNQPAILAMHDPNIGEYHAVFLRSTSYKRFLFFKYSRKFYVRDPIDFGAISTRTYSQMSHGETAGYGFRYRGQALVKR